MCFACLGLYRLAIRRTLLPHINITTTASIPSLESIRARPYLVLNPDLTAICANGLATACNSSSSSSISSSSSGVQISYRSTPRNTTAIKALATHRSTMVPIKSSHSEKSGTLITGIGFFEAAEEDAEFLPPALFSDDSSFLGRPTGLFTVGGTSVIVSFSFSICGGGGVTRTAGICTVSGSGCLIT
jgi:hypothetical protein